MRMLFRQHWPALALAILVGLILITPPLVARFGYRVPFSSPANIRIDDEFLYFARSREVLDGHPTIGNAYLAEHKGKPSIPFFLGEWLLAQPLKFLGVGVVAGNVLYDFVFPAIGALLTYTAIFLVSRLRWLALLGTAFLFWGLFGSEFGRAWSPQFVFLFWLTQFLLLGLLVRDFEQPRRRMRWGWLAAINFGFNVYLYPYTWTFYAVAMSIAAAAFALRRDFALSRALAAVVGIGFAIAVPYFILVAGAARLPEYAETLYRISMIDSRLPSGVAIVLAALGLLAAGLVMLRRGLLTLNRQTILLASGVIAAMVAVNQHLLTGKNFEFSSHYLIPAAFWFTFTGAYLLSRAGERLPAWRPGLGVGVVLLTVIVAGGNLAPASWLTPPSPERIRTADRALAAVDWIRRNAPPDSVVYTTPELSELVPIYTGANVFFAAPVRSFVLPDSEVVDRFILSRAPASLDRETIISNFRVIYGNQFLDAAAHQAQWNRIRTLLGLASAPADPVPEAAVARVEARARELERLGFGTAMARYRLDYMIWDRERADAGVVLTRIGNLEPIADVGVFRIWQRP